MSFAAIPTLQNTKPEKHSSADQLQPAAAGSVDKQSSTTVGTWDILQPCNDNELFAGVIFTETGKP